MLQRLLSLAVVISLPPPCRGLTRDLRLEDSGRFLALDDPSISLPVLPPQPQEVATVDQVGALMCQSMCKKQADRTQQLQDLGASPPPFDPVACMQGCPTSLQLSTEISVLNGTAESVLNGTAESETTTTVTESSTTAVVTEVTTTTSTQAPSPADQEAQAETTTTPATSAGPTTTEVTKSTTTEVTTTAAQVSNDKVADTEVTTTPAADETQSAKAAGSEMVSETASVVDALAGSVLLLRAHESHEVRAAEDEASGVSVVSALGLPDAPRGIAAKLLVAVRTADAWSAAAAAARTELAARSVRSEA